MREIAAMFSLGQLIQDIRTKSFKMGVETNKSEIVRAGLRALMDLPDAKLVGLLKFLPKIKTGRIVEKKLNSLIVIVKYIKQFHLKYHQ